MAAMIASRAVAHSCECHKGYSADGSEYAMYSPE